MAAAVAALLTALALAPSALAAPALPLGHAGRWLTDARGRVVILHGLNMIYKRRPYAPDAAGFDDDDAAFLAREGFDTVRLGVIYAGVEPRPGTYDDAYLDRIERTVKTLGRHGIVSLLDFHQDLYAERFQGEGWPDWAIDDDDLPAAPKLGFPGNYGGMPALGHAFDHFWADDPAPGDRVGLQERYAAAWAHVADRFKDNRFVLGYDLMNEPWPGTRWRRCQGRNGCPGFDAELGAFVARGLAAIRSRDPDTLVFYEPHVLFNDGVPTHLRDTGDADAALSFHDYCGSSPRCRKRDDRVFANAERHARATGDALLLTEFGATDDRATLRAMADRADRFMVGWQEWHYCPCEDPTTIGHGATQAIVLDPRKPPRGANVRAAKIAVLARPHARAIAGTPTAMRFDPRTRRYTLRYRTRRADGRGRFGPSARTEIALPRRQYPHGYRVEVRGGRVRSAHDAPVLRVSASRRSVRVTVTPR
jgi:endoglycosylceramidase